MHGELGHPQVDGPHARVGGDDGPDGRPARAVVPHDELLHGHPDSAAELANQEARGARGGVPLVGVRLDHQARVHRGGVLLLVLRGVVGVHRVGHVHAQDHGPVQRRPEALRVAPAASLGGECLGDPLDGVAHDGRARAALGAGPDLLVVEERHHAHVPVRPEQGRVRGVGLEGLDGGEARGQVVEPRPVDELLSRAPERAPLSVVQGQVEVHHLRLGHAELRRQEVEQDGVLRRHPRLLRLLALFLLRSRNAS
mmetsp:Transcript_4925/g.11594  ORF Transcript_4925/g.11594 Transcript_4925/m.11594 type:complete len:254 (-) Transcript_4925:781-1542(-)